MRKVRDNSETSREDDSTVFLTDDRMVVNKRVQMIVRNLLCFYTRHRRQSRDMGEHSSKTSRKKSRLFPAVVC